MIGTISAWQCDLLYDGHCCTVGVQIYFYFLLCPNYDCLNIYLCAVFYIKVFNTEAEFLDGIPKEVLKFFLVFLLFKVTYTALP